MTRVQLWITPYNTGYQEDYIIVVSTLLLTGIQIQVWKMKQMIDIHCKSTQN